MLAAWFIVNVNATKGREHDNSSDHLNGNGNNRSSFNLLRTQGKVILMQGQVTKKHFFLIVKEFGVKKAVRILFSRQGCALNILMDD